MVFDLDACLWFPEMFEVMQHGGSPFKRIQDGVLKDKIGNTFTLCGDVGDIMHHLKMDKKWAGLTVGVASLCANAEWANECIAKFPVCRKGIDLTLGDVISRDHTEIYKGCKKDTHLANILKKLPESVTFEDFLFFDDIYSNCEIASGLGVTSVYVPENGVTWPLFNQGLAEFPAPGKIVGPERQEWR